MIEIHIPRMTWQSSWDVLRYFEDRPDALITYIRWGMRRGYSVPGCCLNTVAALAKEPLRTPLGDVVALPRAGFFGTRHFRNLEALLFKIEVQLHTKSGTGHGWGARPGW